MIFVGIILIIIPIIGSIYISYKQSVILSRLENSEPETIDMIQEYQTLEDTLQSPNEYELPDRVPPKTMQFSEPAQSNPLQDKREITEAIGLLTVNKIGLKIPVVEGVSQESLSIGAGHIPGTAHIGETGNVVLAGHRSYTFGIFFNRLDELEIGDEIDIKAGGSIYSYFVYNKKIVEPTDLSVLSGNNSERQLTLITCHPPTSSRYRLIIQARMNENSVTAPIIATP